MLNRNSKNTQQVYNNNQENSLKRETINFNMRLTPLAFVYLDTTLLVDTNDYKNPYYQPNYYYSFGYDNNKNNTFGFAYSNYKNNLFLDNNNPYASSFLDGTWAVNYKTKIKNHAIKLDLSYQPSQNRAIASINSNFELNKYSKIHIDYQHYITYSQDRLAISAKTKLGKRFHIEGGIYLYSNLKLQEDYEADYYYRVEYKSKKFSIEYSNKHQNTRWSWREERGATFLEGNIKVSYLITI